MWDHSSEARTASGPARPSGLAISLLDLVQGRIDELGTHNELLARNGYYTSLFEKQRLEEELSVAT